MRARSAFFERPKGLSFAISPAYPVILCAAVMRAPAVSPRPLAGQLRFTAGHPFFRQRLGGKRLRFLRTRLPSALSGMAAV